VTDLAVLTVIALVFCAVCWEANVRSERFFVSAITLVALLLGFAVACAGLIQMATQTL